MQFKKVDPDEIDNIRRGRRGRVSYPILKSFMETGMFLAEMDTTGIQQSKQSLSSSLNSYIRNHEMPIKLFQRGGKMYLMRLDIDKEGNEIPDWQINDLNEKLVAAGKEPLKIDPDTVEKQFTKEKGKVTK